MELELVDPFTSEFEKNKICELRDFQQCNLDGAQAELPDARNKLNSSNYCPLFGAAQPFKKSGQLSPFPWRERIIRCFLQPLLKIRFIVLVCRDLMLGWTYYCSPDILSQFRG
jgi:hypothetical protein